MTLHPAFTAGFESEWKTLRRNALDLGSRPCHNGTPLSILSQNCTLNDIRRENNRQIELDERVYWGDDEAKPRKKKRVYRYLSQLDGILEDLDGGAEDPFCRDIRTFGDVLAWMHRERINVAGYPKTERERVDCEEGRCRCLGPMVRDV